MRSFFKWKIHRDDGSVTYSNSPRGQWDVLTEQFASDMGLREMDITGECRAAEVENPRGVFELVFLKNQSRYWMERVSDIIIKKLESKE
jgi:hypothetical protein